MISLMESNAALALAACASFVASLLIVSSQRWHGRLSMDSDLAGVQKFHTAPVPRIGGLALLIGLLVPACIDVMAALEHSEPMPDAALLILAGLPIFAAGLVEDLTKKVSVLARLLGAASSALAACALLDATLVRLHIPGLDLLLAWMPLAVAVTMVAVVGVSNAVNVIDGFHGIAGSTGIWLLLGLGLLARFNGDDDTALLAWTGIGAILGFLLVNYPTGRIFLGDGGAYLLGFWIAEVAVLTIVRNPQVTPWAALAICGYPVIEVLFSIYRKRYLRGRSATQPDRVHLHMLLYRRLVCLHLPLQPQRKWLRNAAVAPMISSGVAASVGAVLWVGQELVGAIVIFAAEAVCYVLVYRRLVWGRWRKARLSHPVWKQPTLPLLPLSLHHIPARPLPMRTAFANRSVAATRWSDRLVAGLLLIAAVVSVSPISTEWVPVRGNLVFVACCIVVVLIRIRHIRLGAPQLLAIAGMALLALAYAAWWQDFKLAFYPAYLALTIVTVSALTVGAARAFVSAATALLMLLAVTGVIGVIYAYLGGGPLLTIENPDGRPASLYAVTMTNDVVGNLIRPSGIFDEPGALAFYICFTAACRSMFQMSRRTTWLLLACGTVTFSLAYLVYLAFHLLSERPLSRRSLRVMLPLALAASILALHPQVQHTFGEQIGQRLQIIDGRLAGDNRSDLFENAVSYLDPATILTGLDALCVSDWPACQKKYGNFGENVLTPMVQGGLATTLPFYIVLASLLFGGLRSKSDLFYLGAAALLIQRPYVMNAGYCLLIYFFYYLTSLHRRGALTWRMR